MAETERDAVKESHDNRCAICLRTEDTVGTLQKAHVKTDSKDGTQVLPMCPSCHAKFDEGLFTDAQLKDFAGNPQAFVHHLVAARDHLQAVGALDAAGAIDVYKARAAGVTGDELRAVTDLTDADIAKIDAEMEYLVKLDTGEWISRRGNVMLENGDWIPRDVSDLMEDLRYAGVADSYGDIDLYKARAAGIAPSKLQQVTDLTAAEIEKIDAELADLVQLKTGEWIKRKDYATILQQASPGDLYVLERQGIDAYNRSVEGKGLEGVASYRRIIGYKPGAPERKTCITQILQVVQLLATGQSERTG